MEQEPIDFFVRHLEGKVDAARSAIARFINAPVKDVVFVPNATAGVNTVLRSLRFRPGDELLVSDHEYNACRNALNYVAGATGAKIVVAHLPFSIAHQEEILERLLDHCTGRTRLVLIDHVTSQTGLILPLARIIQEMDQRGIETLVDGAHAPGMIPLNLRALKPTYYTGNCHKWLCAPKSSAFLYVRPDRQEQIHPLSISHGANSLRQDRSKFLIEFGWTGTADASAMLSVPNALEFMEGVVPGGWKAIMARNRSLTLEARRLLCDALAIPLPCPDSMIGSLASVPLPDAASVTPPKSPLYLDELQEKLFGRHRIEVPVVPWPAPPRRLLRISAQLYNSLPQYKMLAESVVKLLGR